VIIMSIYAILGVEFFMDYGMDFEFTNEMGQNVPLVTGRGFAYGDEYFGNYGRSMYTLYQVLTGESWSEAVARPLIFSDDNILTLGATFYFASFIVIVGIVLINVVVAVLLEKMVDDEPEEAGAPEEEVAELEEKEGKDENMQARKEVKAIHVARQIAELKQTATSWEQEEEEALTEVEVGVEALRHEMVWVKQTIRLVAETCQTMKPVFTQAHASFLASNEAH